MRKILAAVPALLIAGTVMADAEHDVRCREIAFSKSVENGSLEAFREFLDADARFVGSAVMRGPDEIVAAWQVFFDDGGPTIKWRPQFVEVLEDGRLALTRGPFRMKAADPDGNTVEQWGTFNSVWRLNDDEQWHVVFDAGSPATGAPDDATQALLEKENDC